MLYINGIIQLLDGLSVNGNLVDLETDLRGTSRMNSKCPTKKYQNQCKQDNDMTSCQPSKIVLQGKKKRPEISGL